MADAGPTKKRAPRLALGLVLVVVTLASLAWVAGPIVIIQPFAPQTPRGLAVSYVLRLWSPALTVALLLAGLALAIPLWRLAGSWKGRILPCLAPALLLGSAVLARQNHFEWMFRPLPHPAFAEPDRAQSLDDEDLVLGVHVGTEARAYPVRALAYHHIVNDVVASEPIVATY